MVTGRQYRVVPASSNVLKIRSQTVVVVLFRRIAQQGYYMNALAARSQTSRCADVRRGDEVEKRLTKGEAFQLVRSHTGRVQRRWDPSECVFGEHPCLC